MFQSRKNSSYSLTGKEFAEELQKSFSQGKIQVTLSHHYPRKSHSFRFQSRKNSSYSLTSIWSRTADAVARFQSRKNSSYSLTRWALITLPTLQCFSQGKIQVTLSLPDGTHVNNSYKCFSQGKIQVTLSQIYYVWKKLQQVSVKEKFKLLSHPVMIYAVDPAISFQSRKNSSYSLTVQISDIFEFQLFTSHFSVFKNGLFAETAAIFIKRIPADARLLNLLQKLRRLFAPVQTPSLKLCGLVVIKQILQRSCLAFSENCLFVRNETCRVPFRYCSNAFFRTGPVCTLFCSIAKHQTALVDETFCKNIFPRCQRA